MRVLFHGASVTQQNGDSSYFYWVEKFFSTISTYSFRKRGYGGTHFDNACVLTIKDDIKDGVDVCFLDWNTTGSDKFRFDNICYVAGTLLDLNIRPIFLIFGRSDNVLKNRPCDDQIISFCIKNTLEFIDLRKYVDPVLHLRDNVHTNISGAKLYSDHICRFLQDKNSLLLGSQQRKFDYSNLKIDSLRDLSLCINEGSSLSLNVLRLGNAPRVMIETVHGPESPIIRVDPVGNFVQVWDQWSHFHRPGFVEILTLDDNFQCGAFSIKVLSDPVDYSICNRPFNFFDKKYLTVNGLFGIDCEIEIY